MFFSSFFLLSICLLAKYLSFEVFSPPNFSGEAPHRCALFFLLCIRPIDGRAREDRAAATANGSYTKKGQTGLFVRCLNVSLVWISDFVCAHAGDDKYAYKSFVFPMNWILCVLDFVDCILFDFLFNQQIEKLIRAWCPTGFRDKCQNDHFAAD